VSNAVFLHDERHFSPSCADLTGYEVPPRIRGRRTRFFPPARR
jgi:hypothetical protein